MPLSNMEKIKVLFVASEAAPLVKIGGLGDYVGSLPKALLSEASNRDVGIELDIRIALPFTQMINPLFIDRDHSFSFTSKHGKKSNRFNVYTATIDSIPHYILENLTIPDLQQYVYSADPTEDGEKFISFSLACSELMKKIDWKADIVQCNDWQTGVLCAWLKSHTPKASPPTKSIFVIHNLPFMGAGTAPILRDYGIRSVPHASLPAWGKELPLLSGIVNADKVITVSPTYAKEILTPDFGNDLQDFLITQQDKLSGILNGIDQGIWDPETDPFIASNYSCSNLKTRLMNKEHIQLSLSLEPNPRTPLLVMVSRLDVQKGVNLLVDTLHALPEVDWQAVILGTGNLDQEQLTRQLEQDLPHQVRVINRFEAALSHQLYAGGDMFLMPSLYEPCGTSQMIAMRYGCIPIAHAVGGLVDSIRDEEEQRTGFLFSEATAESFSKVLTKALNRYRNPKEWVIIQKRAMQQDFSWKNSARKYLEVYKSILKE